MLRVSFLTPFKAPRLYFFSISKISLALAYGTFFPLLGPFTNKCLWLSKYNKGKVNKYTEFDGGYSCIPNTLKIIIFRGLKLHISYATIFHVFLAALRQSCPSQCKCFSPPPLKIPFPDCAKHISPWSLSLQWLHKGIRVKNNLGEESRGKCGAEQGHKDLPELLKSSKGNYFISWVHSMLL